ncbi:hypothetical protein L0337_24645 [candidate division KSB1 bacterium]|nr:hypothetical protein [candidate division KSB1 bacterium]
MAKPSKATNTQSAEKTDQLLDVLQDLFILESLKAGMNVDDIRKILKINKWRVSNISKYMKKKKDGDKQG